MATTALLDSYTPARDNDRSLHKDTYTRAWQSFHAGSSDYVLYSAKLYCRKVGLPTGNVTVSLYAHSGTYGTSSTPTGSPLATATVDISTLSSSYSWVEVLFTGANKVAVPEGNYCIVFAYNDGASSVSNCLGYGTKDTSPTHGGNIGWWFTSWTVPGPSATKDLLFEVWGEVPAAGLAPKATYLRRMRQ